MTRSSDVVLPAARATAAVGSSGGSWRAVLTSGWGGSLSGIAATGPANAWVTGSRDEGRPVIEHWDGTAWREIPPAPGMEPPNAVAAATADTAWVFSHEGSVWRWTGRWTAMGKLPVTHVAYAAATGRNEAWVAGSAEDHLYFARWTLTGATAVKLPASADEQSWAGISALSNTDVWAATTYSALHWDGRAVKEYPFPEGVQLMGIAAVSADEVWAVGMLDRPPANRREGVVFRWDGSRWSAEPAPEENGFSAVAPDGRGGIWVTAAGPSILHHDSRGWTRDASPDASGPNAAENIAALPGTDRAIVVGGQPSWDEDSEGWLWMRN